MSDETKRHCPAIVSETTTPAETQDRAEMRHSARACGGELPRASHPSQPDVAVPCVCNDSGYAATYSHCGCATCKANCSQIAMEAIAGPAILWPNGAMFALPIPASHFTCSEWMRAIVPSANPLKWKQGFATSSGRFVDRDEGKRIALSAEQIVRPIAGGSQLFSEELYIDPQGFPLPANGAQPSVAAATDEQIERWAHDTKYWGGGEDECRGMAANSGGEFVRFEDHIARIDELRAENERLTLIEQSHDNCADMATLLGHKRDYIKELEAVTGPTLGCCGRRAVEHRWASDDCRSVISPSRSSHAPSPELAVWLESRK